MSGLSQVYAAALAVLFVPRIAYAVTTEPDNTVVPRDSKNGETQLYTLFQNRNDPVDWLADAHTTPATFSPLCNFSATFVLHQAGSSFAVGWYNADPNATTAPTGAAIHVIVPAGTAVGAVITSQTIKSDPAYAGGLIGFALMGDQIHYSEQKWNVSCTFCSTPGPWATAVVYQSKNTPEAYYLAFEDGTVSAFGFNNDGDFNDDVFFFQGLTCEGGGTPCTTSLPGLCAAGLNECSATGLVCKSVVQPGTEKCNGVDDDCNGQVDDGNLCDAGFVCDHGTCVAKCGDGEFQCSGGKVCNTDGFCVDAACSAVSCAIGTVCVGGKCVAPCDGIVCPSPTVCRVGVCVDPCSGVECLTGSVCEQGICVPGCGCNPCPTGTACDTASQHCVEPACVAVSCAPGTRCAGGVCGDPCASAVCPDGQACTSGLCIGDGTDGGVRTGAGGTSPDSGAPLDFSGGAAGAAGAASSGGTAGSAPAEGGGANAVVTSKLGCGCRLAPGRRGHGAIAFFIALLVTATGVRRRQN
jgi:hypothetical protein